MNGCTRTRERLEAYADLIRKTMLDMYASFRFGCVSGAFSAVELYAGLYLDRLDTERIARNGEGRLSKLKAFWQACGWAADDLEDLRASRAGFYVAREHVLMRAGLDVESLAARFGWRDG
ncbi:MAG TPA: hypothetical protein VM223_02880 [Planctomycetota bacterium]|nr:hypothetical protein [Planctomycetota bacterium]